jgi:hypothetical protein
MDDRRFDNVVRALARHRSRRGLMGGLLGEARHWWLRTCGCPARRPTIDTPARVSGAPMTISAIRGSSAGGTGSGRPVQPVAAGAVLAVRTTSAVAPKLAASMAPAGP